MKEYTDTERLDFLQKLSSYGHGWVFRKSESGRGYRLHESSRDDATPYIREAIDNFINSLDTCSCGKTKISFDFSWECPHCKEWQKVDRY